MAIWNIKRIIPRITRNRDWNEKTGERLDLDALAYNMKRLYNLIQEEQNNEEDIVDFYENTLITRQLKLDVLIY